MFIQQTETWSLSHIQFMRRLFIVLLILFFSGFMASAQKLLTSSRQSSYYTYIYQLEPADVLNFYKLPDDSPGDKILRRPVDSFKTDKYWENRLPPGNYLKVSAQKNRIAYALVENHSAFIKIFENKYDQRFAFLDKQGKEITNAVVKVNNKAVLFDNKSKTYYVNHPKEKNIVEADYAGVANFFIVKEKGYDEYDHDEKSWFARVWAAIRKLFKGDRSDGYHGRSSYTYRIKRDYTGFMVFNKPIYKPHDTVKFKAFILYDKLKQPITVRQLQVSIGRGYNDDGKPLGVVNAYRDGGFEYSFVLSDSLKLTLDEQYTINLQGLAQIGPPGDSKNNRNGLTPDGHQQYLSGHFRYEDYELKSIHFNARIDKSEHRPGDAPAIYLKATDENDLPVPDGRVTLTLTTYKASGYKSEQAFVRDTLWEHKLNLDPVGETKVVIPDSIFPKADVNYEIHADFLNSSNESHSQSINANYLYENYSIATELRNDTLVTSYKQMGRETGARAVISALDANDDTISKVKVMLPSKTIINPGAKSYDIETDSTDEEIALKDSAANLSLAGERTADSLFVKIDNPRNLHFWYSVFAGDKLIDAGEANQLLYKRAFNQPQIVTFLVNYIWAGESRSEKGIVVYRNDKLNINVRQPLSVYPGQQAQTDIVVTDVNGKPVANADVTAWSVTSKFKNYTAPAAPYLGRSYPRRKEKKDYETDNVDGTGTIKLNWDRWSHEMGLDSIAYYNFTHTKTIYRDERPTVDTISQIAPFIVRNGEIIPVHILSIDERPVYFSQAQQLQQYSFRVTPGRHSLRFRTSLQNIRLDTVSVKPHQRLILGVNADFPPSTKASDTLSTYEARLINQYMITMIDNFDRKMALIEQGDHIFMLNPNGIVHSSVLTGPLSGAYTVFDRQGQVPINFVAEPGYSYLIEPGFLKQKSVPDYPFNKVLSSSPGTEDYAQYVLTRAAADSAWQDYLDSRSNSQQLFTNERIKNLQPGKLIIEREIKKNETPVLIRQIIVYKYDDPDFIMFFPGNTTDFGRLDKGNYRLLFLLKGDRYTIKENVVVKPYGINFYKMPITATHARDSVSIKINTVIDNRQQDDYYNSYSSEKDATKIKETFNDQYLNTDFPGRMSGQVIGEDDKKPLAGVSVVIKGTRTGVQTDINGNFSLKVPEKGKLVVLYIGYDTQEFEIQNGETIKISMKPSNRALTEVVVVGYGVTRKKDITGAVTTVNAQNLLNGRAYGLSIVPGAADSVRIRGISTVPGQQPLYIVDGVPVTSLNGIDPASIGDINVLKSAAATALYGARAANGVVIITTHKKNNSAAPAAQPATGADFRKNFSDYAYWQPKLTTDASGKASFITTYPDDITNWRTFVIGVSDQKQSGSAEGQIKSYKPLSASFIAPLFAVQGDDLSAIGKVTNYNADPVRLTRSFNYNGKLLKQDAFEVKNTRIDTLTMTAGNTDTLTFEYSIKRDNGYFDGERRKIPVIEKGVNETKGIFQALNTDTTVRMNFDPALGPVTFRAEASVLPALIEEAQRLREYKYLCNEQLSSKLKGLLAERRIKIYLGQPFKWDRNIREIIKKIQENRRADGTWGWWKDTDEELWISLHAIEALTDAAKDGYTIDIDQQKLTDYLVYQLESYRGEDKITCLQLLEKLNAKVDYAKYIEVVKKELGKERHPSKYDQFRLVILAQQAGIPVKLDSLFNTAHRTMFGNIYWGEDNYNFFDNSIQLSAMAYKIIKNEGKHPDMLSRIRDYFLEQRKSGGWRNTYESSIILETILPDLLKENKQVKPSSITITGDKTETITTFPYSTTLSAKTLSVSKTGGLPVYITGYQQFWNPNPEKVSKDFTVDAWFERNGNKLSKLKGGEKVELKAEVTARGDADYVMVEIPIPAGCSYEGKEQSWQNNEVHREYFKEKVSIFCRKLKQGKYTFTINLMPRYDGKYNLNPAKAEMMYFPVFYGREGMKNVIVGN